MSEEGVMEAELPLESIGARLMRAREARGLSRAQMAAETKIPERHLAEIEANNFAALPARTYAVGFTRSYAKALGLDEREVVEAVRTELAAHEPAAPRALPAFEPGDPARVPGSRFAWLAALAALIVILAGFAFAWRSYYLPGGTLPSVLPEETAAPAATGAAAPAPVGPSASSPVVFTALAPKVWVKFYDGTGKQLMQKEMAQGETWTVPQDAPEVKIWTAHPEQLGITIGGQNVAKLADEQKTVKDVSVTAASLLARGQAVPAPAASQPAAAEPAQTRRTQAAAPARREAARAVAPQPSPAAVATQPPVPAPTPAPVAPAT